MQNNAFNIQFFSNCAMLRMCYATNVPCYECAMLRMCHATNVPCYEIINNYLE